MTHPETSTEEFVAAYFRYFASGMPEADAWAPWDLDELVAKQPDYAWPLILALIDAAPSDSQLATVAAGPLENIINKHGRAFMDRIDVQARRDRKFRRSLMGVWYGSDLAKEVRELLEKYTRGQPPL